MEFNETYPESLGTVSLAVREGNLTLVRTLIEAGRPTNRHDNKGWKPLHHAAHLGTRECLELLLGAKDCDPNWQTFEGETPLYLACRGLELNSGNDERTKSIRALLKHDQVDVNKPENFGQTALHAAVKSCEPLVIKWLVRRGAFVNAVDFWGQTPLHCAVESKGDDSGVIVNYLIKHGAHLWHQDESELTPFSAAIVKGHSKFANLILDHVDETMMRTYVNLKSKMFTPLALASLKALYPLVLRLLELGADPNGRFSCPWMNGLALHAACHGASSPERCQVIKKLLEVTSPCFILESSASNPFMICIESRNWDGLKLILNSYLKADSFTDQDLPWPYSIHYNHWTPFSAFLNDGPSNLSETDYADLVRMFLSKGNSFNSLSSVRTVPPLLCSVGSPTVTGLLLELGADIPQGDLILACSKENCFAFFSQLNRAGKFHPELAFGPKSLPSIRDLFEPDMHYTQRILVGKRLVALAWMSVEVQGTVMPSHLVKYLRNILVAESPGFLGGNEASVFDEMFANLLTPSSLKMLSRACVRRQLLAVSHDNIAKRTFHLTDLPTVLHHFVLLSDLDFSNLKKFDLI